MNRAFACPTCFAAWLVFQDKHDRIVWPSKEAERAALEHSDAHGTLALLWVDAATDVTGA